MKYSVRVRKIDDEGRWEEWEVWVDAKDDEAALSKVLRRRHYASYLLEGGRYRFNVKEVEA